MSTDATLKITFDRKHIFLEPGGTWTVTHLAAVDAELRSLKIQKGNEYSVNLQNLSSCDTAGAWILSRFLRRLKIEGISYNVQKASKEVQGLLDQVQSYMVQIKELPKIPNRFLLFLDHLGHRTMVSAYTSLTFLSFLGEVALTFLSTLLRPWRFRFKPFCTLLQRVGVEALPIVGLISFLIGIVLTYQSVDQLKRFGAEIFTIDLLAISVLREIGILLTAIVVAGRSGSSFTAQIGFMKLNQEVDAMVVLAMNPTEVLVLPRILALIVALPLLAFFSDFMAVLGGGLMSMSILDLNLEQFFQHLKMALGPWTFWVGIIKAPFFAFVIALVGCFEGLRIEGGARSVGIHTTKSVVESIFMVIVLDAAFSIVFSYIGI